MTKEEHERISTEMMRLSLEIIQEMATSNMMMKGVLQSIIEDYAVYEKKMKDLLKGHTDENTQH